MKTKLLGNTLTLGRCDCCKHFAIIRRVQIIKRNIKYEVPYQFADYFTDDRNFVQVCSRCEPGIKSFNKKAVEIIARRRAVQYPDWLTFIEMLAVLMRVQKLRAVLTTIRSENENK